MSWVYHYWAVIWSNPHKEVADGYEELVCVARIKKRRGEGAGRCPDDVEDAMRYWNRLVSGQEYGGGYSVGWWVEREGEGRKLSEDVKQRIRRQRMERRIRARYPLFAEEFISEELTSRPEYFGTEA